MSDLTEKLTALAVKRVKAFKFVVAGAATVGLGTVLLGGPDARPRVLFAVAMLVIAMVLFFLQFAVRHTQRNPKFARRFSGIVAFVFSSVAVTFAALMVMLLVWLATQVFERPTSADVARIDKDAAEILAARATWESALNPEIGGSEPGLADVATRAAQLAEGLERISSRNLSWQYDLWRHRWISYGFMISCSANKILGEAVALAICLRGLGASDRAQALIAQRREDSREDSQAREDIEWIEREHIDGRTLRDYATMAVVAFELSKDSQHLKVACRALDLINPSYRRAEGARTSPILRPYLASGTDICKPASARSVEQIS